MTWLAALGGPRAKRAGLRAVGQKIGATRRFLPSLGRGTPARRPNLLYKNYTRDAVALSRRAFSSKLKVYSPRYLLLAIYFSPCRLINIHFQSLWSHKLSHMHQVNTLRRIHSAFHAINIAIISLKVFRALHCGDNFILNFIIIIKV